MAGFFKFVDVVPEHPAAPAGGSGLFAMAAGALAFVGVALLETVAEQSSNEGADGEYKVVPGPREFLHPNHEAFWE
jgi:hypothetical protein